MSPRSPEALLVLLALLALQRLLELRRSARNARATRARGGRAADPGWNWRLMVVVQGAWIVGTGVELAARGRVPPAAVYWTALAAFALGQALRLWCIRALGPAWNARAVVAPRQGVVSGGPYRWVRHPNYLAVAVELVALPVAAGAWITLALTSVAFLFVLRVRILAEEALLREIPGYAEAMGHKGRFLPRWRGGGAPPRMPPVDPPPCP